MQNPKTYCCIGQLNTSWTSHREKHWTKQITLLMRQNRVEWRELGISKNNQDLEQQGI